ncbi:LysR family transcriptional regulator [Mesorhizobium sp. 1B3]|uniref:LysR family transcriptional regulator n=1 Tax=Mesorhizobium sp. 1B3 TaxID=3243599 RepID=UPI003D96211A
MKINLRQIEAFRLVFQTGSMTTAARLMSITQPAVSRLIRDLEETTELALFKRSGSGISASPDAISFFNEVERSFLGLQHLEQTATAIRQQREKFIHVAATGAFAYQCLPHALMKMREKYPGVRTKLTVTRSSEILDMVSTRRCDLGITATPPNPAGIDFEDLPTFPIVCVLPRGHRLSTRSSLSPRDMAGESIFCPPENTRLHQEIARSFELAGAPFNIAGECTLGISICEIVALGAGISILDSLSARGTGHEKVVTRPFEPRLEWEPKLLYPAGSPRSKPLTTLTRAIHSRLDEIGNLVHAD